MYLDLQCTDGGPLLPVWKKIPVEKEPPNSIGSAFKLPSIVVVSRKRRLSFDENVTVYEVEPWSVADDAEIWFRPDEMDKFMDRTCRDPQKKDAIAFNHARRVLHCYRNLLTIRGMRSKKKGLVLSTISAESSKKSRLHARNKAKRNEKEVQEFRPRSAAEAQLATINQYWKRIQNSPEAVLDSIFDKLPDQLSCSPRSVNKIPRKQE